jgi:hypothetical protein
MKSCSQTGHINKLSKAVIFSFSSSCSSVITSGSISGSFSTSGYSGKDDGFRQFVDMSSLRAAFHAPRLAAMPTQYVLWMCKSTDPHEDGSITITHLR